MNNSFTLRRFAMLWRKHYIESGRLYLLALAGVLVVIAGATLTTFHHRDMYFYEGIALFSAMFFPLLVAKMSFASYYITKQKMTAFTLPATQGEKYLFGVVNTLAVSLAIYGLIEVGASITAQFVEFEDYVAIVGVGSWFDTCWDNIRLILLVSSMMIFACSMSKDSPVKAFGFTCVAFILLGFIPTLLVPTDGSMFLAERPSFLPMTQAELRTLIYEGDTVFTFTNEVSAGRLVRYVGEVFVPVVMLLAGYFKFREHQMR